MTIASLIVNVAADVSRLQTDVSKIHGQFDSVSSMATKMGGVIAGAFTLTAVTGAVSRVMNFADEISNLAEQTGLSKRTLQEMDSVAARTGTTLEAFTGAAFKLGTAIASGDQSVVSSVERLGLSWYQLRQMSPDQQFNAVATALGGVENAQERNRMAVELFGKSAKQILPAIGQGYDELAKSAYVASDAQIDALDAAGDALDGFLSTSKSVAVQIAGGLIIAVREAAVQFERWVGIVDSVKKGLDAWEFAFETVGLKARTLPAVFDESAVKAKLLPPALAPITMSVAQVSAAEKLLTEQLRLKNEQNREALKAQEEITRAHKRFTDSVKNDFYTSNYYVELAAGVRQANFELEELASTLPSVAQNFVPFREGVRQASLAVEGWASTVRDTMTALPTVIMSAIQGGGSVIAAAGAHIGTSLMSRFQEKFGPAISTALPFGIGNAINALLPTLGALFGPIAERIGGFFRSIFGGPSADELRGRQAVADFEAQLHSTLNATQQLEAGQDSWKKTVIAIRDAYLAVGLTEADALLAAERLWASSRNGGAASQAIIDEIKRIMEGGALAAGQFAANLDYATRNRTINIGFNVQDMPDIGGGDLPGFATGSGGIRDFGAGTPVMLHGRERVQTESQMQAEQASRGDNDARLEVLMRDLPRALKIAFADAMLLSGSKA